MINEKMHEKKKRLSYNRFQSLYNSFITGQGAVINKSNQDTVINDVVIVYTKFDSNSDQY